MSPPLERPPPRLVEPPEFYNDLLTSAQVKLIESTAKTLQDWVNAVCTQIRAIIGDQDWKDDPTEVARTLVQLSQGLDEQCFYTALCAATDSVGDWVRTEDRAFLGYGATPYGAGPFGTGPSMTVERAVTQVDTANLLDYPAEGVIVYKPTPTLARVQFCGIVKGVYTNLDYGRRYYIDKNKDLVEDIAVTGLAPYAHALGVGCDVDSLLLRFDVFRREDLARSHVPLVGAYNGVNLSYQLPWAEKFEFDPPREEPHVTLNGMTIFRDCDYSISESGGSGTGYDTITIIGSAPRSGDRLDLVRYTAAP